MVTKNCSRKDCTQLNPQLIDNFGSYKRAKSGLRSECKTCRSIESAKQYAANPAKAQARNARWATNNPEAFKQSRIESELNAKPYRRFKKNQCEAEGCGFIAIDLCQLDVDHIDGNHSNNDPANLQTLCANCHRLKTKLNKDGAYSVQHMKLAGNF